tara:strand:- start:113 stop:340 length:228 start_codon:yes stop_codon:yes gene_type:complete
MTRWVEITQEEFKGLELFMKSFVSGFGICSSVTDMSINYAETIYGAEANPMLRTRHVNGVNEAPIFYKRVKSYEL